MTAAARVQAAFSHAHPECVDAAVASAWLLRFVMESGSIDRDAIRRVIAGLNGGWAQDTAVAGALVEALERADRPQVQWLDAAQDAKPSTLLCRAVTAALLWRDDPGTALDRAARVHGGRGVAALTGMLVGAASGPQALPQEWLKAMSCRDELCAQATSLVQWGEVRRRQGLSYEATECDEVDVAQQLVASLHLAGARFVPDRDTTTTRTAIKVQHDRPAQVQMLEHLASVVERPLHQGRRYLTMLVPAELAPLGDSRPPSTASADARTSQTDPIRVAWLTTGLRGRIGLTFAPGKCTTRHFGPAWDRNLDADLERLSRVHDIRLLVPLLEDHELLTLRIPFLQQRAEDFGVAVARLPIPDGGVPLRPATRQVVDLALSVGRAGYNVCFHCRGGLGRAGTLAACTLVRLGLDADAAMKHVREVRPGAIENALQERFVTEFEIELAHQ